MPDQSDHSADTPNHTDPTTSESQSGESSGENSGAEGATESAKGQSDTIGVMAAQQKAQSAAKELLDHDFEGIIEVSQSDTGTWQTLIEVVERRAVPDTQDLIGRYEIQLSETGEVTGYELRERYQRGDTKSEL